MLTESPPRALRIAFLFAASVVVPTALAGCMGEEFLASSSAGAGGGGAGGAGGDPNDGGAGGDAGGSPPVVSVRWPDSRTQRCSNGTTVVERCPGPEDDYYGQDGNYRIAVPTYTKTQDGSFVTDSVTGLTWERARVDTTFTLAGAVQHCASLAASEVQGHKDWRLPSRRELVSILDLGHTAAFPDAVSSLDGLYWSNTASAVRADAVWGVDSRTGFTKFLDTGEAVTARALCVAGEMAGEAELIVDEEIVVDVSTGLVWQREPNRIGKSWREALAYCEALELAGKDDWRLPSAKELQSIVEDRRSGPSIDITAFPDTPATSFWTSTPALNAAGADHALVVDFTNGASDSSTVRGGSRLTRCVRSDGQ